MSDTITDLLKKGFSHKDILEIFHEPLNTLSDIMDKQDRATEEQEKYPTKDNGFYKQFTDENGKLRESPDYNGLADYLIEQKHLKCDDSLVYVWDGKHYKSTSFLGLKNIINSLVKEGATSATVNNFYNKALIKSYVDFTTIDDPVGVLNCKNGVLDVKTGVLKPHKPDRFLKYVLDHDFDKRATCPTFMNSLRLVTNDDPELQLLIQQVFGYCIAGGHPKAHKAFMFYGEGGNGKSTILTALSNLVGISNSARVPLTLFDKPFSMISLDGKLVNLIDETPKFNINPEAFKNVVSGGYVRAAHKGKPEVDLKINARILFACNKLPNFKDDSDGMMRRLIIIPFNHRIPDSEADRDIDEKIKGEMSGVLNWALTGLNILMDDGYRFHSGKATKDSLEEYKEETDSVHYFFTTCVKMADGPERDSVFLAFKTLYKEYVTFCSEANLYAVSSRVFSRKSSKYYDEIYKNHGLDITQKDRQKMNVGKGIARLCIVPEQNREVEPEI